MKLVARASRRAASTFVSTCLVFDSALQNRDHRERSFERARP